MEGKIIGNRVYIKKNPHIENISRTLYLGKEHHRYFSFSFIEALYLYDNNIISRFVKDQKIIDRSDFIKIASEIYPKFIAEYKVFRDLLSKGFKVGSGYKFGAAFRIYDKRVKEIIKGKIHSRWICQVFDEGDKIALHEFSSKNRVAHSTRKSLLMAIVGKEIRYLEVRWRRM